MKKCLLTIIAALLLAPGVFAGPKRLAVKVPIANVRSGPGQQYEILWKIGMYHPLVVLEKSGAWLRFRDFEKDEGWIHRSLVGRIPAVITVKEKCNIRSGPGTQKPVLFTAEKGVPFKVLKRKKHWIYVEHADGDRGWIHKSLVW